MPPRRTRLHDAMLRYDAAPGAGAYVREPVARGGVRSVLALPGVAERGTMMVHNHPSGVLEPSDADLEVAARLHDGGVGFGIVDNDVRELYVVVEVPRAREEHAIDAREVAET